MVYTIDSGSKLRWEICIDGIWNAVLGVAVLSAMEPYHETRYSTERESF